PLEDAGRLPTGQVPDPHGPIRPARDHAVAVREGQAVHRLLVPAQADRRGIAEVRQVVPLEAAEIGPRPGTGPVVPQLLADLVYQSVVPRAAGQAHVT